ncbi:MAG TPA: VOC family protein [Usitatibacter sp.]|nr:VOC family protein [Usitatibacter sp.]
MATDKAPANVAVWFEIPANDFERAVGFYEKVFETKLITENMGGAQLGVFPYEEPGNSGCVIKGESYKPGRDGCVVYLESKGALDGPLARAVAAGGKVATPKTALPPGMGFYAHFMDSEGNRVGLHSVE